MNRGLGSRDRVLSAIAHEEVDRVPCYFGAEDTVWERVMQEVGARDRVEVTRHFGADTIQVSQYRPPLDLVGVQTLEDSGRVRWPAVEDIDVEGYVRRAQEARATGLAVLGGVWATIFTGARRSMGEAAYLMAMLDQPDLIARLAERDADSYLAINEALFSRCADSLDICYFGSDLGTQQSLFVSHELLQRFFLPHVKRIAQHAKGYGLVVMYHTCGAVSELIPDLIACGVDVLDPVQVSAAGMQAEKLARYRGQIAFHGGMSTQTLLPFATPDEVGVEVRRTIETLGPTGYICGPDQWMMADVPTANMAAMYEAVTMQGSPIRPWGNGSGDAAR